MFGKLLSGVVKVVTVPLDLAEAAVDVFCFDGDGSKESRSEFPVSKVRDATCEALEDIDK